MNFVVCLKKKELQNGNPKVNPVVHSENKIIFTRNRFFARIYYDDLQ
jgi:hypothetical protein